MGSLSVWHWLIVLAIVVLVFGTGKLKNMGKDLAAPSRALRKACVRRMTSPLIRRLPRKSRSSRLPSQAGRHD